MVRNNGLLLRTVRGDLGRGTIPRGEGGRCGSSGDGGGDGAEAVIAADAAVFVVQVVSMSFQRGL